ncbi:hypothetical protein [Methylosinus trichosporium]|uniref:hypothetical protein n=1 Tax=Methylosinus trichosporium TaxID=426 RepID=UPI0024BB1293|nr:hypothetical protein [Methylosinus trichosporium]
MSSVQNRLDDGLGPAEHRHAAHEAADLPLVLGEDAGDAHSARGELVDASQIEIGQTSEADDEGRLLWRVAGARRRGEARLRARMSDAEHGEPRAAEQSDDEQRLQDRQRARHALEPIEAESDRHRADRRADRRADDGERVVESGEAPERAMGAEGGEDDGGGAEADDEIGLERQDMLRSGFEIIPQEQRHEGRERDEGQIACE